MQRLAIIGTLTIGILWGILTCLIEFQPLTLTRYTNFEYEAEALVTLVTQRASEKYYIAKNGQHFLGDQEIVETYKSYNQAIEDIGGEVTLPSIVREAMNDRLQKYFLKPKSIEYGQCRYDLYFMPTTVHRKPGSKLSARALSEQIPIFAIDLPDNTHDDMFIKQAKWRMELINSVTMFNLMINASAQGTEIVQNIASLQGIVLAPWLRARLILLCLFASLLLLNVTIHARCCWRDWSMFGKQSGFGPPLSSLLYFDSNQRIAYIRAEIERRNKRRAKEAERLQQQLEYEKRTQHRLQQKQENLRQRKEQLSQEFPQHAATILACNTMAGLMDIERAALHPQIEELIRTQPHAQDCLVSRGALEWKQFNPRGLRNLIEALRTFTPAPILSTTPVEVLPPVVRQKHEVCAEDRILFQQLREHHPPTNFPQELQWHWCIACYCILERLSGDTGIRISDNRLGALANELAETNNIDHSSHLAWLRKQGMLLTVDGLNVIWSSKHSLSK